MHDYDVFTVESKAEVLEKSRDFWNPGKTDFWSETGVDLVIDRRESYFIWDMSGIRLIDVHLNGGTYNLGHRNPELVEAITVGMRSFDIGNHHFPSSARAALAEALIRTAPPNLTKVVYGSGGERPSTSRSRPRGTPPNGARSSRSSRPTTAIPGWPWPPATTASPSCSSSTPGISRTSRSTTSPP